jgi:hypothetical protein
MSSLLDKLYSLLPEDIYERSFYLWKLEVCFQLSCGNWYRTTENYIWLTLSLLTFDHNSIVVMILKPCL